MKRQKVLPASEADVDDLETRWRLYAANFFSQAAKQQLSEEEKNACLHYAYHLFINELPIIYDGNHLSTLVGYQYSYLIGASLRAHNYYRSFTIEKRSGKLREIAEPLPSLKEIQKWILENILEKCTIHSAAKAYAKGKSIKENARFHRKQKRVLTIDIQEFFHSIDINRVFEIFFGIGYSTEVSALLAHLCCLHGRLPQGAPSSPAISNIVAYSLDQKLFQHSRDRNLRYTRYADDITMSGVSIRHSDIMKIYESIRTEGFEPNLSKTRLMREHQRQQVTGIVVNTKLSAPREVRRELRQHVHYIKKFGFEVHAKNIGLNKMNFRQHLIGKAHYILHLDRNDRDAMELKRLLLSDEDYIAIRS